jgi:hypothetical protein
MLLARIDPFWFFISLAVGFFAVYILAPTPEVVVKFPSPYNAGHIFYKDRANMCYKYKAEEVSCPRDKTLIKPQPLAI